MPQHTTIPPVSLPTALIEVRGASGRCYGQLDTRTGVITFVRGGKRESIDLTPYFKAATIKDKEYQGS